MADQNGNAPDVVDVVHLDTQHLRMSPQVMRMLTAATGRTMEQLMASDESADKFQAMAFIELHRRHRDLDAAALWELAGATEVELSPEAPDPFRDRVLDGRAAFAHYWRIHPDAIDDLDPAMYAAMVRLMQREAAAIAKARR